VSSRLRTARDPLYEMQCSLERRIMEKVQEPRNIECCLAQPLQSTSILFPVKSAYTFGKIFEGHDNVNMSYLAKVMLSSSLTKRYVMEAYWGVDVEIHVFLTSTLVEMSCQPRASAALPPRRSPRYPSDMRLSEPQSRSGRYESMKILEPTGTRTPIL
jgi:hypothetical protein